MRKLKSKIALTMGLTLALLAPATSSLAAENYTWDYLGGEYYNIGTDSRTDKNWISTGGNFKVDVSQVPSNYTYTVELWESDGSAGSQHVSSSQVFKRTGPGYFIWYGLDGYNDGTDGKAEFFVKIKSSSGNDTAFVKFYD